MELPIVMSHLISSDWPGDKVTHERSYREVTVSLIELYPFQDGDQWRYLWPLLCKSKNAHGHRWLLWRLQNQFTLLTGGNYIGIIPGLSSPYRGCRYWYKYGWIGNGFLAWKHSRNSLSSSHVPDGCPVVSNCRNYIFSLKTSLIFHCFKPPLYYKYFWEKFYGVHFLHLKKEK